MPNITGRFLMVASAAGTGEPERPQGAPAWRELALAARRRGDRAAALEHWREAVACEPQNPDFQFEMTHELRDLGRLDEAEATCRSLAETVPERSFGWRGLALIARRRGDRAAALDHWRKAVACEPRNPDFQFEMTHELRDLGRLDEAEAICRSLAETVPDRSFGWRGLAFIARTRGNRAAALEHWRKAVACEPQNSDFQFEMTHELRDLGRLDEAEAICRRLAETVPERSFGWRGLAFIARTRGNRAAALDHWRRAVACEPQNSDFQFEMTHELRDLGRLDAAEAICRSLAAAEPQRSFGWRGLALIARRRGDRAAALDNWRKAVACEPQNSDFKFELTHDLRDLGQIDEAEAICRGLAEAEPQRSFGWRGLAFIARRRGDRAVALDHWRRAVTCEPNNLEYSFEMSHELRDLGRLDEAEAICRNLAETAPDRAFGWRGLAFIARRRGNRAAALDHWRQASVCEPNNLEYSFEMTHDLRELGRLEEAEVICRGLTETAPESSFGWRGLAFIARKRGNRIATLEHWRSALACEPHNVSLAIEIVHDLRELGQLEAAETAALRLKQAHPTSAAVQLAYAQAVRHRSSAAEVIDLLQQAVMLEPDDEAATLTLAGTCLAHWRFVEAEAHYTRMLARNDRCAPALAGLAEISRRRGDRGRALALLAEAAAANPEIEGVTLEYARELADAGQVAQAVAVLQDAIARQPAWSHCHLLLSQIARDRGDRALARRVLAVPGLTGEASDHVRVEQALDGFRQGDADGAVARLRAILAENPRCVRAIEALGGIAQALDDLAGALQLFQRAAAMRGPQPGLLLAIADLQLRLGQPEACEASFQDYERRFGASPDLAVVRARVQRRGGSFGAARAILEAALAVFPAHFGVWAALVEDALESGAFDRAEHLFSSGPAATIREQGRALHLRGQLRQRQWRLDAARQDFTAALELLPADSGVHNDLCRCALLCGDVAAAQRHLDAGADLDPHHRALRGGGLKPRQTHVGQLLDEYRLDAPALARLCQGLAAADPVAQLSRLVADMPDHTPAAIALMVALRQQGRLQGPPDTAPRARLVPRKIGQFWDTEVPPDVARLCESWQALNPGHRYRMFSAAAAARFLREVGAHDVLAVFHAAQEPAMKADIFRLAYLFHEGGYYVDADDRCIAPLDGLDPGGCGLILYQEDLGTLGNNFMAAAPGHAVIGLALREVVTALQRGDTDSLWLATGPGLVTRSVARVLAREGTAWLGTMRVLERHELARCVAVHCVTSYKYTQKHWSRGLHNTRDSTTAAIRAAMDLAVAGGGAGG